jgi:hypothetical protein
MGMRPLISKNIPWVRRRKLKILLGRAASRPGRSLWREDPGATAWSHVPGRTQFSSQCLRFAPIQAMMKSPRELHSSQLAKALQLIVAAAEALPTDATIDGEAVVRGDAGVPPPLEERKDRLRQLLKDCPAGIQFNDHIEGDGATVFAHACKLGFEGIVSKDCTRPYRSGRSKTWLKIKNPAAPGVTRFDWREPAPRRGDVLGRYSATCVRHRTQPSRDLCVSPYDFGGVDAMRLHADQHDLIIRYQRQRELLLCEIKESQELIERCQEVVGRLDELLSKAEQERSHSDQQ